MLSPTPIIENSFSKAASVVIYHGDTLDFLGSVPSAAFKLIVTSPPYNLGKAYEGRVTIQRYLRSMQPIIAELGRALRPDGSICWQVGNFVENGEVYPLDIYYYGMFKDLGLQLRNRIIWGFGHGLHASRRFSGRYETLLWFTKTDKYTFNLDPLRVPSKYPGKLHYKGPNRGKPSGNPLGKNPSDVWDVMLEEWESCYWDIPNVKSNHPEKTVHPCQFPVELAERCVLAFTDEGDWVYDPFAGVGSTLIAALRRDRRCAGSEQEQAYVDIARDRIHQHFAGTLKVRKIGTPVHTPSGREKIVQRPDSWEQDASPQPSLMDDMADTAGSEEEG